MDAGNLSSRARLSPGEPSGEAQAAREAFAEIKRRISRAREMMAEDYPQPDQSVTRAAAHLLGVFCFTGTVEAALAALAPPVGSEAPPSPGGGDGLEPVAWRCFQCDELLTTREDAEQHFGRFEDCVPACKIGVERFRAMEAELADWRSENDASSKAFYSLGADHSRALVAEEQRGYDKGLADGRAEAAAEIEALRARVEWRPIATAPRQEPVIVGHERLRGWRRLAICNALGEWSYCDRPWLQQDPLDEEPTHWMAWPDAPPARQPLQQGER